MDDRAQRPTGLAAWVGGAIARWRADEPDVPLQWTPPRGLGELSVLLDQVRAAGAGAVLPPIKRDDTGTSLLTAREWCARAGLSPAVGVLAVLLASEAEKIGIYPQYAWAIGEACINAAAAHWRAAAPPDRTPNTFENAIMRRVVGDSRPGMDGRFTKQGGRWASTAQQPGRQHVRCAELLVARALAGDAEILAHGATQWTDNQTQDVIHQKAIASGDLVKAARNPAPEPLMHRRYTAGAKWVGPLVDAVGTVVIDPWLLSLLGPVGVDEVAAQAMLADGRRRWKRPA